MSFERVDAASPTPFYNAVCIRSKAMVSAGMSRTKKKQLREVNLIHVYIYRQVLCVRVRLGVWAKGGG